MIDAWVLNASPIILYARIGRLDIIERLTPGLIVPATVTEEVKAGVHKDTTAKNAAAWAAQFQRPDILIPSKVEPGGSQLIPQKPKTNLFYSALSPQHSALCFIAKR